MPFISLGIKQIGFYLYVEVIESDTKIKYVSLKRITAFRHKTLVCLTMDEFEHLKKSVFPESFTNGDRKLCFNYCITLEKLKSTQEVKVSFDEMKKLQSVDVEEIIKSGVGYFDE